jgi:hypothetical protein
MQPSHFTGGHIGGVLSAVLAHAQSFNLTIAAKSRIALEIARQTAVCLHQRQ